MAETMQGAGRADEEVPRGGLVWPDAGREAQAGAGEEAQEEIEQRERFEERAAIREYDAGFPRAEAERLARLDVGLPAV